MKKILILILCIAIFMCASAQYISLQQGTSLIYKTIMYQGNGNTSLITTAKIFRVSEFNGEFTVLTQEVTPLPQGQFGEKTDTTTTVYTAADNSTKFVMSTPEEAKKNVIDMVKMQIQASGQSVGIGEIDEFISSIRAKGELSITINPDMAAGTKLPNKNMRISVGQDTMSYNLWEVKVDGKEEVTTPAGTFECLKVSFVNRINAGGENQKINVTEWFAPGVGAVKVEQAIKGKPFMSQELVKLDKPQRYISNIIKENNIQEGTSRSIEQSVKSDSESNHTNNYKNKKSSVRPRKPSLKK